MMKKGLYLVTLGSYVAAVFLVTSDHFWAGIVCMGIGTCFLALAKKVKISSDEENMPEKRG